MRAFERVQYCVLLCSAAVAAALQPARPAEDAGGTATGTQASQAKQGYSPQDWPQYRGPKRDNAAGACPKLLDAWPAGGPELLWKSGWIPGWYQGGCSGPVVADERVYVYATWKQPLDGGNLYKPVTPEALAAWGWVPDLPPELAKKIEDARVMRGRPHCQKWPWYEIKDLKEKDAELDAFLAKKPDMDRYIKDFMATLDPADAKKYGNCIKKRLCIEGLSWEQLAKLSELQGAGYATCRECAAAISKTTRTDYPLFFHLEATAWFDALWRPCFTRTDTLVCLDAKTGKTHWKKDFPLDAEISAWLKKREPCLGAGDNYQVLGVCATPTVRSGKCYFAGAMGLYCVSAQDGALIWQVKAPPAHASPLVVDGAVYHCGSAYNAENGKLLWKTPLWRDNVSHTDPGRLYAASSCVFGGKTYIFACVGGQGLACLDLQTGKDIWTTKNTGPTIVQAVEVRVAGDVLVSYGKMYKMTPAGVELAKTLVDFPGMSFGLGGVIWQDHLYQYVFAGEGSRKDSKADGLCCWDLKSGELKWAYRGPTCPWDLDYTPPIVADGKIIYAYGSGPDFMRKNDSVAMYLPTPEKYTLLGSFEPGMIPWTPIAFSGGRLFLRTEAGISCYDLRAK